MSGYTWDIVIARIKARRDARAESGVDVANYDSIIAKMERRDAQWFDDAFDTAPLVSYSDSAQKLASMESLDLAVALEKLHTLRPSLKIRMLADEAARLAERVNALIESE